MKSVHINCMSLCSLRMSYFVAEIFSQCCCFWFRAVLLADAVKMFQLCSLLFAVYCQCVAEGIEEGGERRERHK